MTHDKLNWYEKWPVGALFVAQGLQVFEWYVDARMPPQVRDALPWLVTAAGASAFVAIDGAMIATVAGMRAGRRGWWSVAAIMLTAAFGALVALNLHGALPFLGPWLHAGFAVTIAAYLMHLAQPVRARSQRAAQYRALVRRLVRMVRAYQAQRPGIEVTVFEPAAAPPALDAPTMRALPAEPSASRVYACVKCGASVKNQQKAANSGRWGCANCKVVEVAR